MRCNAAQMAMQAIKKGVKQCRAERTPLPHSIQPKQRGAAVPPTLMESAPPESSDLMAVNMQGLIPPAP